MSSVWYACVSALLIGFAVLDGFDFGAGALHLWIARTDRERRAVLAAIGPLWDGNEVWFIAAGGSLFLSFPVVLGAALSGFYLAIFMVLWLLILRGIAIEFRSHLRDSMWAALWDAVFGAASTLLPLLLGIALGNIVRGVPLHDESGEFLLPLFASFSPFGELGLIDWYTLGIGVIVVVALVRHGALFLARRATAVIAERAAATAKRLHLVVALAWLAGGGTSLIVAPHLASSFVARPLAWLFLALALVGFAWSCRPQTNAFFGSLLHLTATLALTAACHFPRFLHATNGFALTTANASPDQNLVTALAWWAIGFPLAVLYFVVLWRMHNQPIDDD